MIINIMIDGQFANVAGLLLCMDTPYFQPYEQP